MLAVNTLNEREIANNYIQAWIENKRINDDTATENVTTETHYKKQKHYSSNNQYKRIKSDHFDYSTEENRSKRICYSNE